MPKQSKEDAKVKELETYIVGLERIVSQLQKVGKDLCFDNSSLEVERWDDTVKVLQRYLKNNKAA